MWTARPHKHQVCTQVQDPIVTTGYHLAGTKAKSKIVAEHQAQQHSQAEVPSSDSTKVNPYHDDWDKDYEYISESDEELQADKDEEGSESDDNTYLSKILEAETETQEPEVLTQEQEPQS